MLYGMTKRVLWWMLVGGGCGSVKAYPDSAAIDASHDSVSARCDVTKPFGAAVQPIGVNTTDEEISPWLSADQLTIYFARQPYPSGGDTQIYQATRSEPTGTFGNAVVVQGVNSAVGDDGPALTGDALMMFLWSDVNGGDIVQASRNSPSATFTGLAPVAVVNSTGTHGSAQMV